MNRPDVLSVKNYLLSLQDQITRTFVQEDPEVKLQEDCWERPEGGGGLTKSLSGGGIFEKAGINFSHIYGKNLPQSASAHRAEIANSPFEAMGLSLITHPRNPYVPTCHANFRFFLAEKPEKPIWWFGGGFDLTPYYGFKEDCIHWHKTAKTACDPFGANIYQHYKKWADDYFFLKHRNEPRGIGGLFFDDLNEGGFDHCFNFLRSIGDHFLPAYMPILLRRKDLPFNSREREFQCYRRGRYVEFNLIYDRGTLFGLQSGGRTESILISLPPEVSWHYNWYPKPGSVEEKLYTDFLVPKNWVD